MQLLTSNLTTMAGPPHHLISNYVLNPKKPSSNAIVSYPDGPNVEGSAMFYHSGNYYLLYNSGCLADERYKVKYLVCKGAPAVYACDRWTDGQTEEPVLLQTGSSPNLYAPGSANVVVGPNVTRVVYHGDLNPGWFNNHREQRIRGMYVAELEYKNETALRVSSVSWGQSSRDLPSLLRLAACILLMTMYLAIS